MDTGAKLRSTLAGIIEQTRRRAREGHLPVAQQFAEMVILKVFYGLGPGHYHTARYWRRDLPWAFKTGFWSYKKFREFVSTINPPVYQKLSQSKLSEKAILQMLRIPTPEFIGRFHLSCGVSVSGQRLTNSVELDRLLLSADHPDKVCFKLVEGYGGQGFQAIQCIREDVLRLRMLDSGDVISTDEFVSQVLQLASGADYIVEEYIEQHPDLALLNPSSVNTLRIWASSIAGTTSVIDAFLRVGRAGALVDNTSRGAQIFKVDVSSGLIGMGMEKNIYNEVFECHRDSGHKISGTSLPFWHESLSLAQQAVSAFPHIMFAGVDIAITDNGPVVIELNVEPDPTSAIIFDRSHRDLLSCFNTVSR